MRLKKPEPEKDEKKILEADVQSAILKKYGTRSDMRLWRMNVGAVAFPGEPVRYVKFGVPGFSDLHGIIIGGQSVYIECKRPVGGKQSDDQKTFQKVVEAMGAIYILARSVEDVDEVLLPAIEEGQQKHMMHQMAKNAAIGFAYEVNEEFGKTAQKLLNEEY